MLLIEKNLESLLKFVILVFPRLAYPTLVPGKYFVLKNLSFYKVVQLTNAKARQALLDMCEKNAKRALYTKLLV